MPPERWRLTGSGEEHLAVCAGRASHTEPCHRVLKRSGKRPSLSAASAMKCRKRRVAAGGADKLLEAELSATSPRANGTDRPVATLTHETVILLDPRHRGGTKR